MFDRERERERDFHQSGIIRTLYTKHIKVIKTQASRPYTQRLAGVHT